MKRKNEQINPEEQSVKTEEEQFAEFEEEFNENNSAEKPPELVNPEDKKERKKRKKYISAVAAFVLILGVGVVGNWYYQNTDVSSTIRPLIDSATEKTLGKAELVDATTTDVSEENTYQVWILWLIAKRLTIPLFFKLKILQCHSFSAVLRMFRLFSLIINKLFSCIFIPYVL